MLPPLGPSGRDDVDVLPSALGRVSVDDLMSFAVLAEELHFTRAAERMFVSTGGLSRRIARLEQAVGERLLVRSSRRVTLTPAGARVAVLVGSLLAVLVSLPGQVHPVGPAEG